MGFKIVLIYCSDLGWGVDDFKVDDCSCMLILLGNLFVLNLELSIVYYIFFNYLEKVVKIDLNKNLDYKLLLVGVWVWFSGIDLLIVFFFMW